MKNLYIGIIGLIVISCGGEVEKVESKNEVIEVSQYVFDEASTIINWTAFKFTEKKGVSGTFDKINVLVTQSSDDMFKTLTGLTFTIPVESINSANPERDLKIQDHFFGSMVSTDIISGNVKSINATEALIEVTMNGVSKDYSGNVSIEGEKVTFKTTIDMNDFEAITSVDSLNVICNDLHKGADGVSKLWSEIDISVETTLKKETVAK